MSIDVPPAPSHEAASSVYAQLADFSRDSAAAARSRSGAFKHVAFFVASVVMCATGVMLQICAIALMCAPESQLAQFVAFMVRTLFSEVCI